MLPTADASSDVMPPQQVLDYGPPKRRPPVGLTLAYGVGALLFGAGAGLASCGLLALLSSRTYYNGPPPFAAIGGLGVCLLLWGVFTLAWVAYLRFGPRA